MTIKRWFLQVKSEGKEKALVYLYDTPQNDPKTASMIKLPKSKSKEDLGHVVNIETTEGKADKAVNKYGLDFGLCVSLLVLNCSIVLLGTFAPVIHFNGLIGHTLTYL